MGQRFVLPLGGHEISLTPRHTTNSGTQLRAWALAGWGVTALPDFWWLRI